MTNKYKVKLSSENYSPCEYAAELGNRIDLTFTSYKSALEWGRTFCRYVFTHEFRKYHDVIHVMIFKNGRWFSSFYCYLDNTGLRTFGRESVYDL